jgi:hypothetical protein
MKKKPKYKGARKRTMISHFCIKENNLEKIIIQIATATNNVIVRKMIRVQKKKLLADFLFG